MDAGPDDQDGPAVSSLCEPAVAVVIADPEGNPHLDACLEAYAAGLKVGDELVAVVALAAPGLEALRRRHQGVRFLQAPPGTLTPVLWARGLAAISAGLVRTTIAPCLPAPGWREALVLSHGGSTAAVGSAMEPAHAMRRRDWAVFFLRYRNFMLPMARHRVADVPGDAASYRMDLLRGRVELWSAGFWENVVNADLVNSGEVLVLDPSVTVEYRGGEKAGRFVRQRFCHGIHYGRGRLTGAAPWRRISYAALFVLPGAIFFMKITRDVLRRGRCRGRFLLCLPWLAVFLTAWSLGEWAGSLLGPRAGRGEPGR